LHTALELLTAAQNLIRDPEHWTKGSFARNVLGDSVSVFDDRARCFCSFGALDKAMGTTKYTPLIQKAEAYLHDASDVLGDGRGVSGFNDNHTHTEVMTWWDKARELASADA
jgi:hypothetical protein